jgi:hypothetical protein
MKKTLSSLLVLILCFSLVACTVDQVLADINVLIQIAASIGAAVGNVSPADSIIIQKLSGIATAGIAAIQTAYDTYKNSGATTDLQKVQAAIAAVQTNLSQELAAAHITDPASQQKVTNWVNLIYSTLAAILAALPQLQTLQKNGRPKITLAVTPKTLKFRWDNEVCQNNSACSALVK